jgi:hypothetical protein
VLKLAVNSSSHIKLFVIPTLGLLIYSIITIPYELYALRYEKPTTNELKSTTFPVKFNINPAESGEISCYNTATSNLHYIKVSRIDEQYDFPIGTVIRCKSQSYSDYTFKGWSGAKSINNNTVTIPVSKDTLVVANFEPKFLSLGYFYSSTYMWGVLGAVIGGLGVTIYLLIQKYRERYRERRATAKLETKEARKIEIKDQYKEVKTVSGSKQEALKLLYNMQRKITDDFEKGRIGQTEYMELYNVVISYIERIISSR